MTAGLARLFRSQLIPNRRKARRHEALVLGQVCDCLPILVIEPDIERLQIGALALRARSFWNRRDAVLIEQKLAAFKREFD